MSARSARLARCVVALALALPAAARAQEIDAETERLFDEGVALLRDGRFADARERLERVRARRELPAVVYNLALADRGLGRYVEATTSLERYLALTAGRIDAARRAELEDLLRQCRAGIAYVTVHVAAVGVAVTVDGQRLPAARFDEATPVDPGRHVFVATGEGLRTDQREASVGQGERAQVTLTPRPMFVTGVLRVEPSVPDARVFIDRRRVGSGAFEAEMRPGLHHVTVRAAGLPVYQTEVMVRAGHTEDLRVTLTRETSVVNRWWFWTGVAVVAGLATTGIVLGLSGTQPPDGGTLGVVVSAQSSR